VHAADFAEAAELWYQARLRWVGRRRELQLQALHKAVERQREHVGMLAAVTLAPATSRAAQIAAVVAAGHAEPRARAFLGKLRAWAVSAEGRAEAEAELAERERAVADYASLSVEAVIAKELDELEPALREQLEAAEERNFVEERRKRRKKA